MPVMAVTDASGNFLVFVPEHMVFGATPLLGMSFKGSNHPQ
jgi:hypothetical protein